MKFTKGMGIGLSYTTKSERRWIKKNIIELGYSTTDLFNNFNFDLSLYFDGDTWCLNVFQDSVQKQLSVDHMYDMLGIGKENNYEVY